MRNLCNADLHLYCSGSPLVQNLNLGPNMLSLAPLFFSWWLAPADLPLVIPPPCSDQRFWYCPQKELSPFVYIWRTAEHSGISRNVSDIPPNATYKKYVGIFTL